MPRFTFILKRGWFSCSAAVCFSILLPTLPWTSPDVAAPISVRFIEGAVHGFLVIRTISGKIIASGDLRQTVTAKGVNSRTVFHFKDGSMSEEAVVFTQSRVFSMQTYQMMQRGPAFAADTEISLDRNPGQYRVKTKAHDDNKEKVLTGPLNLPGDIYNGMVFTVAKNLPGSVRQRVHIVAFTPEPRLIELEIIPAGKQNVAVAGVGKTAIHYVLHPQLGTWLKLFTKLTGHTPEDNHVWILADPVPAFVKFEGPLYMSGPVWRIELASPHGTDVKP